MQSYSEWYKILSVDRIYIVVYMLKQKTPKNKNKEKRKYVKIVS